MCTHKKEKNPTFESEEQFKAALPEIVPFVRKFAGGLRDTPPLTREDRQDIGGDAVEKILRYWNKVPVDCGQDRYLRSVVLSCLWDRRQKMLPIVFVELADALAPEDLLEEKKAKRLKRVRKNEKLRALNLYKGRISWSVVGVLWNDTRVLRLFFDAQGVVCESDMVVKDDEEHLSPFESAAFHDPSRDCNLRADIEVVEGEFREKHSRAIEASWLRAKGCTYKQAAAEMKSTEERLRYAEDIYHKAVQTHYEELRDYLM